MPRRAERGEARFGPQEYKAKRNSATKGGRKIDSSRLFAVAARLFRTKGYAATSIRDIAEELHVQTASLYYYIRRKDDLLFEVAQAGLKELREKTKPIMMANLSPHEKLRRFIETHVSTTLNDSDKHAIMLSELAALPKSRRQVIIKLRDAYEKTVRNLLREVKEANYLTSDIKIKYLKLALLNLLNWSVFWYKSTGPLTPDQIGKILASVFMEGTCPDRSNLQESHRAGAFQSRRVVDFRQDIKA